MQKKLTIDQFRALAGSQKTYTGKKPNKYNARRCCGYASKKEYYRAQQLKLLLKAGRISELHEQVSYPLIPSQTNCEGIKEAPVRYVADFVYRDTASGQIVVEDTKGFRTPEYIIKRKLMLHIHGITIKEI